MFDSLSTKLQEAFKNLRGLGKISALRWTISTRYQLPLGTFLGIAAILVVFFNRWLDFQAYRFMR